MDQFRFILTTLALPVLFEISLLQIEGSIGSDSRFNSEHFQYLTNVLNKSETGFLPSRSLYPPFGYPSPPAFYFNNGIQPASPIRQTHHQLYPGQHPNPPFQGPGQHFQERGFTYPPQLPIGYLPTQFGGPTTPALVATSPYPTPSPYAQLSLPSPKIISYPPIHYPHQHGPFPPTSPPPPQFLDGFDVGSLPKQVQVPGEIEINIAGKDAKMTCDFPKYLILVQGIYWHHMYAHDPFGAYFDTQNGFGEHTTVHAVNQWKSVLVIRDYNVDDLGVYRCLSTAILPAELEGTLPPGNIKPKLETPRISPPPPQEQPTLEYPNPPPYPYESAESGHFNEIPNDSPSGEKKQRTSRFTKNSRKMRFPSVEEIKKRVTRQLPTTSANQNNHGTKHVPSMRIPPTSTSHRRDYYNFSGPVPYSYPTHQEFGYRRLTNPYVEVDPFPQIPNNHIIQNERHLPSFHLGYAGFGFGIPPAPAYPSPEAYATGFGLNVPYYKPSYSYCTIYKEVTFQPPGVANRHSRTRSR